jgi:hypothetical protein
VPHHANPYDALPSALHGYEIYVRQSKTARKATKNLKGSEWFVYEVLKGFNGQVAPWPMFVYAFYAEYGQMLAPELVEGVKRADWLGLRPIGSAEVAA